MTGCNQSFNQTHEGIKNLLSKKINVNLRIILNKFNYDTIFDFSKFIINNYPTVSKINFIYPRIKGKAKKNNLHLKNSQIVKDLFFDVITTLTLSTKTKKNDKLPKIDEKEDFQFHNIQKRLCAQMNILPNHIIHFNDPDELRIIINEIFN